MRDNWDKLADSVVGGGLPFLFLIIKQFFREIFGKKEKQ